MSYIKNIRQDVIADPNNSTSANVNAGDWFGRS